MWGKGTILVAGGLLICVSASPGRATDHPDDTASRELRAAFKVVRDDSLTTVAEPAILSASARWITKLPELANDPPEKPALTDEAGLLAWFDQIREHYRDRVGQTRLVATAIDGMIDATGNPGEYIDIAQLRAMVAAPKAAVGLTIKLEDGRPTVFGLTEGGPAKGSLAIGDRIITIDGEATDHMGLDRLMLKMRGEPGSIVSLGYLRGAGPANVVSLERRILPVLRVESRIVDQTVVVVRVPRFDQDTAKEVATAIAAQHGDHAGYVLDLRGNQGGLFSSSIEVADMFLDKGEIGAQHGRTPKDVERYFARRGDVLKDAPLVILVDGQTASGAEILASALQANGRARVVGQPTSGNGFIETAIALDSDSAIRLTTAQYFRADGIALNGHGIIPDVDVLSDDSTDDVVLNRAIALFH